MIIENLRPYRVTIAATGVGVAGDGTVEVDDALGSSLCEQPANWRKMGSRTVAETVEWIGDDPSRARQILDGGEDRKGVLSHIDAVLETEGDN